MANPFDVFDEAPASRSAAPPPAGNPFDKFDEPAKPARPTMGMAEAAVRGAESGMSFGFSDELHGMQEASGLPQVVQRAVPFVSGSIGAARRVAEAVAPSVFGTGAGEAYDQRVAGERAAGRQAGEDQPIVHLGGELAGGLLSAAAGPALAPLRVAREAGIVARGAAGAGNLAVGGSAYGGLSGAGAGEGGIVDRLPSAGQGAAIGAALGPAVGGLVHGGVAGGRFIADNARALRDPAGLADRAMARNFARDGTDVARVADEMEAANVTRGVRMEMQSDGTTLPVPTREVGGQRIVPGDLAGENTKGYSGSIARLPGEARTPAREFLDARQFGSETVPSQSERIADRVSATLGDRGAIQTADEIMARRSAEAAPAFARAHAVKLDYYSNEGKRLLDLLDRIPQEARNEANRILKISDREGSQPIWQLGPSGGYELTAVPNSRHFDYIKRGLDTLIDRNSNPVTGELNTLGGAIVGLKSEILGSLDKLNPAYAAARKVYAGESELLNALRLGQDAMAPKTTTETLRKQLAGMSQGEADMFRLGASNAIRERLANAGDGADKVRLAYGTPALREKMAALAPDQKARDALHGYMRNETAMVQTRGKATGGSPTAERLADDADAGGMALGLVEAGVKGATGNVKGAIRTVVDTIRQVSPELRGRVLSAARNVLLNPDPEALRAFIARVEHEKISRETRVKLLSAVRDGLPRALLAPATGQ